MLDGGYASLFIPQGTPLYTLQIHPKIQLTCDACLAVLATWECMPGHRALDTAMEAHQCPVKTA